MDEFAPPIVTAKPVRGREMQTTAIPTDIFDTMRVVSAKRTLRNEDLTPELETPRQGQAELFHEGYVDGKLFLVPDSNLEAMKDIINFKMRPRRSTRYKHQTSYEISDYDHFKGKLSGLLDKIGHFSDSEISIVEEQEPGGEETSEVSEEEIHETEEESVVEEESRSVSEVSKASSKTLISETTRRESKVSKTSSKTLISKTTGRESEVSKTLSKTLVSETTGRESEVSKASSETLVSETTGRESEVSKTLSKTLVSETTGRESEVSKALSESLVSETTGRESEVSKALSESLVSETTGRESEVSKASSKTLVSETTERESEVSKASSETSISETAGRESEVSKAASVSTISEKQKPELETVQIETPKQESTLVPKPKPVKSDVNRVRFILSGHFRQGQKPIFIIQEYDGKDNIFGHQKADFFSKKTAGNININISGKFFKENILEETSGKPTALNIKPEKILIDEKESKVYDKYFRTVFGMSSVNLILKGEFIPIQSTGKSTPFVTLSLKQKGTKPTNRKHKNEYENIYSKNNDTTVLLFEPAKRIYPFQYRKRKLSGSTSDTNHNRTENINKSFNSKSLTKTSSVDHIFKAFSL